MTQLEMEKRYDELSRSLNKALRANLEQAKLLQLVYRKHVKGDDSIGWEELGDKVAEALINFMGADEFIEWNERVTK